MFTLFPRHYDRVIVKENDLVEYSVKLSGGKITEENYRLLTSLDDPLARWVRGETYLSLEAIAAARNHLATELDTIHTQLDAIKSSPLWQQMMAIVTESVRYYQTDFTWHDSIRLARNPNTPFLWLVREGGTWLISKPDSFLDCIMSTCSRNICYYYDGKELNKIEAQDAKAIYHGMKETKDEKAN